MSCEASAEDGRPAAGLGGSLLSVKVDLSLRCGISGVYGLKGVLI